MPSVTYSASLNYYDSSWGWGNAGTCSQGNGSQWGAGSARTGVLCFNGLSGLKGKLVDSVSLSVHSRQGGVNGPKTASFYASAAQGGINKGLNAGHKTGGVIGTVSGTFYNNTISGLNANFLGGNIRAGQDTFCLYSTSATDYLVWDSVSITVAYREPASEIAVSASSVMLSGAVTLYAAPADPAYRHTFRYVCGNASGTIAAGVATQTTWTVPSSLGAQFPNAGAGAASVFCDTYSGSTLLGTASMGLTFTLPGDAGPTAGTLSAAMTGSTSGLSVYVTGRCRARLTLSGHSVKYGAGIASISIAGGGHGGGGPSFETGTLNNTGAVTFTARVTDTRGQSAETSCGITVYGWTPPRIDRLDVYRSDAAGNPNENGSVISIWPKATIEAIPGNSLVGIKLQYKKNTDVSYNAGWNIGHNARSELTGTSAATAYDVMVTFSDKLGTAYRAVTVSGARKLISCLKDKGIAVGKTAELEGIAEFAWPVRLSNGQLPNHITDPLDVSLNSGIYLYNSNHTGSINNPMKPLACVGICEIRKYDGNNVHVRLTVTAERTVYEAYYRSWMGGWGPGWRVADVYQKEPFKGIGSYFRKENGRNSGNQTVIMAKMSGDVWHGHIYGDFSDLDFNPSVQYYSYGVDMKTIAAAAGFGNYCSYTMDNGLGNGHWDIWDTSNNAQLGFERTGLGAVFQPGAEGRWLIPARIYTTGGSVGSWQTNTMPRSFFINAEFYMRMW